MLARRLLIRIVEKRHGGLLQRPGARRLQLALPQLREVSPLLPIHDRWIPQPVIFGPGQAFISFRSQLLVFPATDPIHIGLGCEAGIAAYHHDDKKDGHHENNSFVSLPPVGASSFSMCRCALRGRHLLSQNYAIGIN